MGTMSLDEAMAGYEELVTSIEALKENLKQLRAETKKTLALLPAAVLPCGTEEETREVARHFYWNCPEITSQAIKDALGWDGNTSLPQYVGPLRLEVTCCACGGRTWAEFSSRSDLQTKKRRRLQRIQCHFCRAVERAKLERAAIEAETEQQQLRQRQEASARWQTETGCMTFEKASTMPYAEYLQTQHWQNVRRQALRRAKYKCQLCNNDNGVLHVHHKTYEHLGDEQDDDLIVLCKACHEKFHDKQGEIN